MCFSLQRRPSSQRFKLLESVHSTFLWTTDLKELITGYLFMSEDKNKLYHLGIKQNVNQSTLSRANENRDWKIFADFGEYLIKTVRPMYSDSPIPNVDIDNDVFALDSTTVSLSLKLFAWAEGKYSRGAIKIIQCLI
jgi:hypothetical protein